ncbi:MAG: MBL fold metallo-hydrolase [Bauldia sp.]
MNPAHRRPPMTVTFWGVRGSTSAPDRQFCEFGGHTPCVEVKCGDRRVVFDAGSGIQALGKTLPAASRVDVFFGHFHYDHVEGLPFFQPLYDPRANITLWSGHMRRPDATRRMLKSFMRAPFFPVGPEVFRAAVDCKDFRPQISIPLGDGIQVSTGRLNHPGNAVAYRLDFAGRSVCYLTDHEHGNPRIDRALERFAANADLVVWDAMYSDGNYSAHRGYGHSTWEEGLRFAERARVGRCALFHHSPDATDSVLAAQAAAAERTRPGSITARDGLVIEV